MRHKAFALAIVVGGSCASAQLLPPPADHFPKHSAFFEALPKRFPAPDVAALAPFVGDHVHVDRWGKQADMSGAAWLRELTSDGAPRNSDDPAGFTVERNYVGETRDGDIVASEFSFPIAPEGRVVFYHPANPSSFATYSFRHGKLVRVVYSVSPPPLPEWGG